MMIKRLSLILAVLAPMTSMSQPVEPWAFQNSGRTTTSTTQTTTATPTGVPIRYDMGQKDQQEESSSGSGSSAIQQMLPQMMSALTGGGEKTAGDQSTGNTTFPGSSSSIDMLNYSARGPNGTTMKKIDACTQSTGRFQFKFGHGGEAGCDSGGLVVSEEFATFMTSTMNRCVQFASGVSYEKGKIYHAGTLPGEDHHNKNPDSLHEFGLAIDVNAIQIDNRLYKYSEVKSKPETNQFFQKFRTCWGEAVEKEKLGCLNARRGGLPQGTVGNEKGDHEGHMHLSLPFCPAQARALGGINMAMMIFMSSFISVAHAEEAPSARPVAEESVSATKLSYKSLAVEGGKALLTLKDTDGEPVSAGYRISVDLTCAKNKKKTSLMNELEVCAFDKLRYNKNAKELEVLYRTSIMDNGRVACRKLEAKKLAVKCAN